MKFRFALIFLSFCTLVVGCTTSQTQQFPSTPAGNDSVYDHMKVALKKQMEAKRPYGNEPIKIQIQPGLLSSQTGPTLELTNDLNAQDDFKLQSETGSVVFQESFVGQTDD